MGKLYSEKRGETNRAFFSDRERESVRHQRVVEKWKWRDVATEPYIDEEEEWRVTRTDLPGDGQRKKKSSTIDSMERERSSL